jgi:biotin-(acetyl-CoA carboxylase) ligase
MRVWKRITTCGEQWEVSASHPFFDLQVRNAKWKDQIVNRTYTVSFTFGATIRVEAESEEEAEAMVEDMETQKLIDLAADGFEIQSVEEEQPHATT